MRSYSKNVACVKCGRRDINDCFVAADNRIPGNFFHERYPNDVIMRTCRNCNYMWPELAKDQEPADYVVGFAFTSGLGYVVMSRKERPAWQKGLLNGVGGKIESGESPLAAQIREFNEECSFEVDSNWRQFMTLDSVDGACRVVFHLTFLQHDGYVVDKNYGRTDEKVALVPVNLILARRMPVVYNVPMSLQAAIYAATNPQTYRDIEMREL